jgi:hypothetical protein
MNVFLKIADRRMTEAERMTLNTMRKAKIAQDIQISRSRQKAVELNTHIRVARWEATNAQDNNKVVLQDLNIELQKLKVMKMRRELGITDDEFEALGYDLNDFADSAGIQRPPERRK